MIRTGFIFLLLLSIQTYGQTTTSSFWKLSGPEKCWTLAHLLKARKAYHLTGEAKKETGTLLYSQQLDTFIHGGNLDAFRHSYWMALLGQGIGEKAARKLGKAHEKGNYKSFKKNKTEDGKLQDATAVEMDLFNNEAGLRIARMQPNASHAELKSKVIEEIIQGKMRILLRDSSGSLCDCGGQKINTTSRDLSNWKLPFCLIPSRH